MNLKQISKLAECRFSKKTGKRKNCKERKVDDQREKGNNNFFKDFWKQGTVSNHKKLLNLVYKSEIARNII